MPLEVGVTSITIITIMTTPVSDRHAMASDQMLKHGLCMEIYQISAERSSAQAC